MFTRDAHRKVSPSTSVDGLTWPFGRCGSSHSGVSCTPCVKPLSSLKETREREGLPGVLEAKVGGKSPKAPPSENCSLGGGRLGAQHREAAWPAPRQAGTEARATQLHPSCTRPGLNAWTTQLRLGCFCNWREAGRASP